MLEELAAALRARRDTAVPAAAAQGRLGAGVPVVVRIDPGVNASVFDPSLPHLAAMRGGGGGVGEEGGGRGEERVVVVGRISRLVPYIYRS